MGNRPPNLFINHRQTGENIFTREIRRPARVPVDHVPRELDHEGQEQRPYD